MGARASCAELDRGAGDAPNRRWGSALVNLLAVLISSWSFLLELSISNNTLFLHLRKQLGSHLWIADLETSEDHRSPRGDIPVRHFLEELPSLPSPPPHLKYKSIKIFSSKIDGESAELPTSAEDRSESSSCSQYLSIWRCNVSVLQQWLPCPAPGCCATANHMLAAHCRVPRKRNIIFTATNFFLKKAKNFSFQS
ncbi:uncharacterized protein LOC112350564 [Selaginella moellendorffii]|uniref:uncharacterized protein LOC112350564 n=1 Tax=Selaginella moellendorffii TaxID=88036 RepID=UPI000D1C970F|nr:uncharacterized protein LOC112350564 [Selaginella moellendorffii]|eukprot:XP_024542712.1 uncharacterized protein LOC112350564 [Selaginella moellendorffii]